jgi:hypothetical protein
VTTLGNFVVGQTLTASDMNLIGTWSSFTVTTTGSANMTFTGQKCVVNKLCVFEIIGTSTGAATPPVTVTLPEAMATLNGAVGFQAGFFDDSASVWYYGNAQAEPLSRLECGTHRRLTSPPHKSATSSRSRGPLTISLCYVDRTECHEHH